MRWALIAQNHMPARILLPLCLPLHQGADAVGQQRDVFFLPRDDVGHLLDRFGQMGHKFFKIGALCHGPRLAGCLFLVQPFAKA